MPFCPPYGAAPAAAGGEALRFPLIFNTTLFYMKHTHSLLVTALLLCATAAWGQSYSGMPVAAFQWRCTDGARQLNFNPAATGTRAFDGVPYAGEYTLVVVYRPLAEGEATVWRLSYGDSVVHALTTERIVCDSTGIRYSQFSDGRPVIHTLRQSAPALDSASVRLELGDSNIMVAEALYFDRRLGNAALRRVQTMLALRYGVTLGPVDYLAGDGSRIWCHRRDSALFHHRITGVGRDTVSGLLQLSGHSEMDGGIVTVATDSLEHGTFLLFGDNDATLTFDPADGWLTGSGCEQLARLWRIQATNAEGMLYTLTFDTRSLPLPTDSLVLLVDGEPHLPAAVTPQTVRFDHVFFPTDSILFTLARGPRLWQRAGANAARVNTGNGQTSTSLPGGNTHFSVYPNPTTGSYTLEVSGARQVQVTVYNQQGKEVASYSDSGRDAYRFEGTLPSGNVYYATVTTENGSRTMKLIVK